MQLRFKTTLTTTDYVEQQAWHWATLDYCPLHPDGGCGFSRHGTYERVEPPGARIPRWYCPEGQCTFSLLADCFAARLSGSLADVEQAVATAEQARSLESAADALRGDDIGLPGVIRWTRRRVQPIHTGLRMLLVLMPVLLWGCTPTITAFRRKLGVEWVLPILREVASEHLSELPPPLGFAARPQRDWLPRGTVQHPTGPDPPRVAR